MKVALPRLAELARTRLSSLSAEWKPLPQQIVEIGPQTIHEAPEGMVRIPAGRYRFKVQGVEIEGEDEPGVDVFAFYDHCVYPLTAGKFGAGTFAVRLRNHPRGKGTSDLYRLYQTLRLKFDGHTCGR